MPELATKNVRINLVATTRCEYSEVVSVPESMTDAQLSALLDKRYGEVSAELYTEGLDWERSPSCCFEITDEEADTVLEATRAMAAPVSPVISARAYSDDLVFDITFDAASWFRQASDEEILALSSAGFSGWGCDYAADDVARFHEESKESSKSDHLAAMFGYLIYKDGKIGFECQVDKDDALRWLETHRSALYDTITAKQDNAPSP